MKKCKFCGAVNEDKATKCSSCGASDFKYQCCNCGAEFDNGKFCPNCGTKVGQVAKKCPNCGNEYYTNACPVCGYVPTNDGSNTVRHKIVIEKASEKQKKKVTFGTVLLWMFFLPIMATIAIWRAEWTTKRKIIVTAVIWLAFLIIGRSNNDSTETSTDATPTTAIEQADKDDSATKESHASEETETVIYDGDEVVNSFLIMYNDISESPFEDIQQGNIRQKVHGHSYGYWCTLLHAADTDKILVTIDETDDNASEGVAGMREIFRDVVVSIDPTLNDDEIYSYFDEMISDGVSLQDEPSLGDTLISFSTDKHLSDDTEWRGFIKVGEE